MHCTWEELRTVVMFLTTVWRQRSQMARKGCLPTVGQLNSTYVLYFSAKRMCSGDVLYVFGDIL